MNEEVDDELESLDSSRILEIAINTTQYIQEKTKKIELQVQKV